MKQLSIFFYLKKDKSNEAGLSPIYGKIAHLGSETTFSTGIFINPKDWKRTKQLTNTKILTEEEIKKKRKLNSFTEKIMSSEEKLRILGKPISAGILKDGLFPKRTLVLQEKPKHTLLQVYAEFLKEKEQLMDAG